MTINTSSTWNRLILIFAKTLKVTITAAMITAAQIPLSRERPLLFDMAIDLFGPSDETVETEQSP